MRIVGIVLLALLVLVLLLLVLVLFVPFTYRIKGSFHGKELSLDGHVFILACLIGAGVEFRDRKLGVYLRILGIRKQLGEQKKGMENPSRAQEAEASQDPQTADPGKGLSDKGIPETVGAIPEQPDAGAIDSTPPDEAGLAYPRTEGSANSRENTKFRESTKILQFFLLLRDTFTRIRQKFTDIRQKIADILQKLVSTIQGIPATIEKFRTDVQHLIETICSLQQKVQCIVAQIKDEGNRQAVRFICGNLFSLLRHLAPRRTKLALEFSTGSPDMTGQLLGVLALFPFTYQKHWSIQPDFTAEEFYVETDFDLRGHIFGIEILTALVRIVLDKNCQKLYNKIS
jgi:hypothetical protein